MPLFTTCLCFDGTAEEAAEFYVDVFRDAPGGARITGVERYPEGSGMPAGSVLTVSYELGGQRFLALNADLGTVFTASTSLQVPCSTQAEIDRIWDALLAGGGEESWCGWLTDRFGFSWQVVPTAPIFRAEDGPEANARVNAALRSMRRIDLAALEAARAG
jgi:predicted 3-demethylubiquinone-9 3-methyltransferase (glyoxalase superfamily)